MSTRIQHYASKDFSMWFYNVVRENFLQIHSKQKNKQIFSLSLPVTIKFSSQVILRLKRRYKPNREIGGILLAEPVNIEAQKTLLIKHIRFIRNVSKNPEKSYLPKGNRIQSMHQCLMGTKKGIRYFPLWFHSHTRNSGKLPEILHIFLVMSTSDADKKNATKQITYSIKSGKITLAFPSALVLVTHDEEVFCGIYGGHVAPEDFKSYMQKILEKSFEDFIKWGLKGESIWRNIAGVVGGIGVGFVGIAAKVRPEFQAFVAQIALLKKEIDADLNYFATSKNQEMSITIPAS